MQYLKVDLNERVRKYTIKVYIYLTFTTADDHEIFTFMFHFSQNVHQNLNLDVVFLYVFVAFLKLALDIGRLLNQHFLLIMMEKEAIPNYNSFVICAELEFNRFFDVSPVEQSFEIQMKLYRFYVHPYIKSSVH